MIRFRNASADRVTQAQWKNSEQWSIPDDIIYELVHYFKHVSLLKSSSWCKLSWLSQDMFLLLGLSKIILPLVYSDIDTTPETNLQS